MALALLLALGGGCSDAVRTNNGAGGAASDCIWENLCACQCAGSPEVRITTAACETANGVPCLPWGSGGGATGGGGTAGAGAGANGSGGSATITDCTFDHQVCLTQ